MTAETANVALQLSEYIAGLRYEDLPAQVVQRAKTATLDAIACMITGSRIPLGSIIIKMVRDLGGVPESTVVTGGFKTLEQAANAVAHRGVDVVGLARALALDPDLPNKWGSGTANDPDFPRFQNPPEGGITAWFTMRLTELGEGREPSDATGLDAAIKAYDDRDRERVAMWMAQFG